MITRLTFDQISTAVHDAYEACKDIKGGQNAGLDTCWVNFKNEENHTDVVPKYEIHSYEELYRLVMEPEELENIGIRNRRHSNEA